MSLEYPNLAKSDHELEIHITLLNKMQDLLTAIREHSLPTRKETRLEIPIDYSYSSFPAVLRDYLIVDLINSIDLTFIEEGALDDKLTKRSAVEFSTGTSKKDSRTVFLHDPVANNEGLSVAYTASLVDCSMGSKPQKLPDIPMAGVTRLLLESFNETEAVGADLQYIDLLTEDRFETIQEFAELHGFQSHKSSRYEFGDAASVEISYTDVLHTSEHGNDLPNEIFINIAKGQITLKMTSDGRFSIEIREDGILVARPEQLLIDEIVANIDEIVSNVSAKHKVTTVSPHELDYIMEILEEDKA